MFVISFLLCLSYFFKTTANNIKYNLTSRIDSLVALKNKTTEPDLNFDLNNVKQYSSAYYNILLDIKNTFKPSYMDINLIMANSAPIKSYSEAYGLTLSLNKQETIDIKDNNYNNINILKMFETYKKGDNNYFNPLPLYSCQNKDFSLIHYKYHQVVSTYNDESLISYLKIKNGRTFNDDEIAKGSLVCIITPDTYQYVDGKINKIKVGDYISYSIMLPSDGDLQIYKTYDLKVIGILNDYIYYKPNDATNYSKGVIIPEKLFLEMYDEAMHIDNEDTFYLFMPCIISLNNIDDIDSFVSYMENLNLLNDDDIKYETALDSYYSFAGNIEALAINASFLFKFSLIASMILYMLLISLDLNKRKKEIGLYLTLGEKKTKLMIQLAIEYILLSLIALVLAIIFAFFLNKYLTYLFQNIDYFNNFIETDKILDYSKSIQIIDSFKISIGNYSILMIIGLEIIITIISTILSLLPLFKFKTREIITYE